MRLLVHAAIIALGLVLYAVSSRTEPRRWRNGVFLLVAVWSAVDLVAGEVADRLGVERHEDGVVLLALPWLSAVVLGLLLLVNGLRMVRREGRSLSNLLSLLLGLGMIVATVIGVTLFLSGPTTVAVIGIVILLLPGYPALSLVSYVLYCLDYLRRRKRPTPAAIVVLGSGLVDGRIPRLLARRLDAAIALRRVEELHGRRPPLVPSGGQGEDEPTSEGAAMTAYLLERGLDEHDVVTEDEATSTEENLLLSRALLEEAGITGHLRVITSGYHVGRAALICRRLGIDADVSGARTAWYFVPSAFLREFVAVLTYHPWVNAVGLTVWAAVSAVLTYAVIAG
ncbi:YdcF family protein [Humibacillus xanthopallidus]|uniref:Uncharacterized SAM-binding protein YcdF (DUF218 family) n=1 Tax=Humibacillus xanthopallidus TaxID=412689 RepID=A0A543I326_9MICO|nr:YdcF family protein [Humibacillus xanthopallidus]TQM64999.1 uncharacterized SAM-binding protein YcdF (DUF218 family) [Humibacillus xanthopallidus]